MRKIYQYILMAVAVLVTASCSNELDEALQPAGNGNLQFVLGDFPAFGEGVATRAIGLEDAGKSAWAENDAIFVSLYSEEYGLQTVQINYQSGVWTPDSEVKLSYLKDETPIITALYAPSYSLDGTVKLENNMKPGMDEYIETTDCTIVDGEIKINFKDVERPYSRLRIATMPGTSLTVTTSGFTPAGPNGSTAPESYTLTTNANGNAFLYGTFVVGGSVTVLDESCVTALAEYEFTEATEPGKSYALYAGEKEEVDLSTLTGTYTITEDGYYEFTGTGIYGIKVESGNPRIVLNNASITVGEGSAIDVASGSSATIVVLGDNTIGTTKTESSDAPCGGIFVAEGGTVNITSNGTDNILRAHGTLAAAIGGKYVYAEESHNAGNINISNVIVYAYTNNYYAAAIGAAGESTCGTINITNAVVYAYGAGNQYTSAPGIGSAWNSLVWLDAIPIVIISNSEVHTFRYNPYSDYIGYLGDESGDTYATGSINCGEGGSATNSTIYCYTGLDATTTDKVVTYDADGNPTEQAAE
jgi:hypothetical protein